MNTSNTLKHAALIALLCSGAGAAKAQEIEVEGPAPTAKSAILDEKELGLVEPLSAKSHQALSAVNGENQKNKVLLTVLLAKEKGNLKAISHHCSKEEQAAALMLLKKVDKIAIPLEKRIEPKLHAIGKEVVQAYEKGVSSYLTTKGQDKALRCKLNLGNEKSRALTLDGMYDYFKDIEPND